MNGIVRGLKSEGRKWNNIDGYKEGEGAKQKKRRGMNQAKSGPVYVLVCKNPCKNTNVKCDEMKKGLLQKILFTFWFM